MDENYNFTLAEIEKLIADSYEEIQYLKRQKMMFLTMQQSINISKSITRLTEDIRKLLRLRRKCLDT